MSSDTPPDPAVVDEAVDQLRERGYRAVVTSALSAAGSLAFVDAGFTVRERLHLLAHDMSDERMPRADHETRRARKGDRPEVLALDALAFDRFWRLDERGLEDAIAATPSARFRVGIGTEALPAYAVSGRAGRHGYLQRLAVHPSARGHGWGRTLVADALTWLRRHSVRRTVVNTQLANESALALYEACGFERLPVGLNVLGRDL